MDIFLRIISGYWSNNSVFYRFLGERYYIAGFKKELIKKIKQAEAQVQEIIERTRIEAIKIAKQYQGSRVQNTKGI